MPPETPSESDETMAAARALRRGTTQLYRRLRAERMSHGLSPSKLSVLGRLAVSGPLTVTALAGKERVQPQSLTRTLTDLEESKLIVRRQDQVDRRQSLTEITALGEDLLRNDARRQATWLAAAISSTLTPVEREVLRIAAQLMRQLADADVPNIPDLIEGRSANPDAS
jgi:DNA-binding MarR family transcriptional regulator